MPNRPGDLLELIRQKKSMAAEISKVDRDYSQYSGGSYAISSKIALIDATLQEKVLPPALNPLLNLYRAYLQKQRKAFFASEGCDVVTKLGFIQGDPVKRVSAIGNTNTNSEA